MRHVLHWIILQGDESLRMINVGIDDESMGNLHKLKVVLENNTCFLFLQQLAWLTSMDGHFAQCCSILQVVAKRKNKCHSLKQCAKQQEGLFSKINSG